MTDVTCCLYWPVYGRYYTKTCCLCWQVYGRYNDLCHMLFILTYLWVALNNDILFILTSLCVVLSNDWYHMLLILTGLWAALNNDLLFILTGFWAVLNNDLLFILTGLWAVLNNAGILGPLGVMESIGVDEYKKTASVNLYGLIDVTMTFLPLIKSSHGRVVNTASILGRMALPLFISYSVTKYGVESFTDGLRLVFTNFLLLK